MEIERIIEYSPEELANLIANDNSISIGSWKFNINEEKNKFIIKFIKIRNIKNEKIKINN